GEALDRGGTALAFWPDEIHELLHALLGDDRDHADLHDVAATRIHAATSGWGGGRAPPPPGLPAARRQAPGAARLALEAYRNAPGGDREAVLDRLQRPEGPIFAYLAEEVVANASEDTRTLVRSAVHFDRFSAPLLTAIGGPNPAPTLEELSKRALFLQPLPGEPGWFALHGLIREYTLSRLALDAGEIRALHHAAAAWFEAQGVAELALASWVAAEAQLALARLLCQARARRA